MPSHNWWLIIRWVILRIKSLLHVKCYSGKLISFISIKLLCTQVGLHGCNSSTSFNQFPELVTLPVQTVTISWAGYPPVQPVINNGFMLTPFDQTKQTENKVTSMVTKTKIQKRKKNKVNNKTVQRSFNIIHDVRWQTCCSFNSGALLLFRALHLMQALYIKDY